MKFGTGVPFVFYVNTWLHLWYPAKFFLEWDVFEAKVVEKLKTHSILSNLIFTLKSRCWDNVEECGTVSSPQMTI